ncbi:hypothetical protein AAA148_05705 [Phocaeicola dorei]|uniref:hypothetical protein n=1 Tax=Phocaeicola dorei TaxID=357276 RepID=UPI0032C1E811
MSRGVPQPHVHLELAGELRDRVVLTPDGYPAHEGRQPVLVLSATLDVEQHFHFCLHCHNFFGCNISDTLPTDRIGNGAERRKRNGRC